MTMILFESEGVRFNLRVGGVALSEGKALLQYTELDTFWVVPSGRVEMMEPATDALKREIAEELGVEVTVGRLLWTVENFFLYQGNRTHEIGLYFLINLPEVSALSNHEGILETTGEQGMKLFNQWHPVDDLDDLDHLDIRPSFLRDALASPPDQPAHVVHLRE